MTTYLKVTAPFEGYSPGDVISDSTTVTNIQADTAFNGKYVATTSDPRAPKQPGTNESDIALKHLGYTDPSVGTLTDQATIALDASKSPVYKVTLGGNRTLAFPTKLFAGGRFRVFIRQDATGTRTLAYGSGWKFVGAAAPTLSTAANALDVLDAVYDGTTLVGNLFKNVG